MTRHAGLTRLLVVALALAISASTALAAPRPAGGTGQGRAVASPQATKKSKAVTPARATPTRKGAAPMRKSTATVTRGRKPLAPTGRTMAAAKVTIGGSLRPLGEPTGRAPARLTRDEAVGEAIEKILRGPLRFGTTGLYVVDAETGRELFAIHPDDPLNPASNVKLISTATALDLLGPDFRYRTRVLGPTPRGGVIAGDVYLLGSYDPTLGRDGLDELARGLAATGVTRIDGDVVVSGSSSRDGLWRSRVGLEIAAGEPGAPPVVTVAQTYDLVEVVTTATTGKRARVKGGLQVTSALITRDDGRQRLQIKVAGTIGKGKTVKRWVTTTARHLHAAHLLRAGLRKVGIMLGGDVQVAELPAYVAQVAAAGRLPMSLAVRESAPLATIVSQVNKRSINWLSDRVVATAAALTGGETPSMSRGVDAMYGWLERSVGLARTGLRIDTGSGLSYRTEFSPRQIVQVMRSATGMAPRDGADPAWVLACADAFRQSLSIGGIDGTLRGRFRKSALRGHVHGKTGTLSRVIALSGLLDGAGGRTLAFSLVTNGHPPARKGAVRQAHEQILEILAGYLNEAPAPTLAVPATPGDLPAMAAEVAAPVGLAPEMPPVGDGLDDEDPDASPPGAPPAAE